MKTKEQKALYLKNWRIKARSNPVYVEKERKDNRDRYYRLNYKDIVRDRTWEYMKKTPEKYTARNGSQHIKAPKGFVKHHWSYNKEHYKDLIFLSKLNHFEIHRFLVYDKNTMFFKTQSGYLLDTKEKHIEYLKNICSETKLTSKEIEQNLILFL